MSDLDSPPGYLLLEDGRVFSGAMAGADDVAVGEVVFNTSMTGYQEVLTDPSYAGQIVTMTAPQIGNYGVTAEDEESRGPQAAGFLMREISPSTTGWRAEESLRSYLRRTGVVALSEVDTRAVTRHIRSAGAMRGAIAPATVSQDTLRSRLEAHPRMKGLDLTGQVTTDAAAEAMASFPSADLPSSPDPLIEVFEDPDRPQPRLDRMRGDGMAVTAGGFRGTTGGVQYNCLSHNTIRGAAGASVLNGELLLENGWL